MSNKLKVKSISDGRKSSTSAVLKYENGRMMVKIFCMKAICPSSQKIVHWDLIRCGDLKERRKKEGEGTL